jgi:nicotinate phosphoribosyltransferase
MDCDFYKMSMGQFVFNKYHDVNVKYQFKNRSGEPIRNTVDPYKLQAELDHVRQLRFNNSELHYLRGTNEYSDRMFCEDYLQFLKSLELPEYNLSSNGSEINLEFEGPWATSIYWETIALSIINELRNRWYMDHMSSFDRDLVFARGKVNLAEKIAKLKQFPDITFTDFGTRRRFSREWQDYVNGALSDEFSATQFKGTSNVYLANKYGLLPMGTSAHELFMVCAGLNINDKDIKDSHNQVLREWWIQYGQGLSVALTDTFGTDFFFSDMTRDQAMDWRGLRQDSGDPIVFGEKAIKFYQKHGIDPRDKVIVFSDGLDVGQIIKIYLYFRGRIKTTFGWGTNLTNDLGIKALSLVIKPVLANGMPLVKLSDNLAKAVGDSATVERYKRIFGYTNATSTECRY